jgi:hypothetical protein
MKVEITIEQFNNGISLKWRDCDGNIESEDLVALERDQVNTIGKTIWDNIKSVMDSKFANIVKLTIEYQAMEE